MAIRAARLQPSGMISVTVEPVTPAERLDMCVRTFGLTPREAEIVRWVARGLDTTTIAHELYLAPYTVQDHLKNIFAKVGVNSRRSLVAHLVNTECLPRIASGSPVGPDGWFAGAPRR